MPSARFLIFLGSLLVSGAALSAAEEAAPQEAEKQPALFHKLTPSLITNVQGSAGYVRCDVQLMTRGDAKLEQLALHQAALRHELLLLLGDQQSDVVKTPKGKEKLRKKALKAVNGVMENFDCSECVDDLYFTGFFVQ